MLSVLTEPYSHNTSLLLSSNDSTHSVLTPAYHTAGPIYCSHFKPTRRKSFNFPVFLLSNIRGGFATKLDEIQQLLDTNDVDIAVIIETWLHQDIDSNLLQLSGYNLFRLDRRDGRQGGGVVVYVKHGCYCNLLSHLTHPNLEVLWLLYRPHSMPREVTHITIGAVYHPPKANNAEMLDYLISTMDEVTRTHPHCGMMLLGDFNQLPDSQLKSYPLQQMVKSATRGEAILDKIYTNIQSWFQTPTSFPPVSRSDHNTVCLQPAVDPPRPPRSVKVIYHRLVSHNRKSLLFNQLSHFNWTPLYQMTSCQEMVDLFYSVLVHWLDYYMPIVRKSVNNLSKPWVTKTFQHLVKQRQRAFMASQTALYHTLRNKVNRMAASLRKKYYENKVEALRSADAHSWWKKTKQFLNSHQTDCFRDLQRHFPDLPLAEELNNFFVSVSSHLPPFNPSLLNSLTHDHSDQFVIEPSQIESKLLRINVHKSPGPDGLPNWLLKEFAPILCDPLAAIFNSSLREGYVPPVWKSVQVVPVPKTNPPSSIESDLRPIAILPVLAKVLESIVGQHLLQFLEPHLDDSQFGSRKGRSTTHAILALLHSWMETLDSGGSVRSVFVDFRKAFDLVDHNVLFHKLKQFAIPDSLLLWFGSYLADRQQRVRANQCLSSWKPLTGGMPQGSWLGPLSFLVLINDLSAGCSMVKYVDDSTLSELLPPNSQASSMIQYLEQLVTWTTDNHMQVNSTKTKEMIIGPLTKLNLPSLATPSGTIERVSSFKLLGVYIESSLCWSTHVNSILKKATSRLYFLKQLKRAGLPSHHLLHYYLSVLRPVLECCAPVWHYALTKDQTQQIEKIQKRAIHIIFNVTRGMPYNSMLYIANIDTLASRRNDLCKKFFQDITQPSSCLHSLLPAPREQSIISRPRTPAKYPRVHTHTKCYCSFINYAFNNNYQDRIDKAPNKLSPKCIHPPVIQCYKLTISYLSHIHPTL